MERFNDKMLTNAALLFVMAIVVAMLVQWVLSPKYDASNAAVQNSIAADEVLLLPHQFRQLVDENRMADYTVVYVGEQQDVAGLFPNQLSIPFAELLQKQQLRSLKSQKNIILIADEETKAMLAANLLLSQGVQHVQAAARNLKFVQEELLPGLAPKMAESHEEKARFDYSRFFSNEGSTTKKSNANAALPAGGIEVKAVAGGC